MLQVFCQLNNVQDHGHFGVNAKSIYITRKVLSKGIVSKHEVQKNVNTFNNKRVMANVF